MAKVGFGFPVGMFLLGYLGLAAILIFGNTIIDNKI